MKISIQMISIGSTELFFLFDHHHHPIIEANGISYSSLKTLLQSHPQIRQNQYLEKLAQIANFLVKGIEFQYIENIELFKENYYQKIDSEQASFLDDGLALKDYGIFDLSSMHAPLLKDKSLIFFVKHDYLGVPYRVTLFFPIENDLPKMTYELLPIKKHQFSDIQIE